MTEAEIKELLQSIISIRNWYAGTSINRIQAGKIKSRLATGDLSLGRILEVLIELDKINIIKN